MAYRSKDWGRARNDGLINIISGLNSRADPVRGNIIGLGQIYTIEQADMLFHSNGTFRKIITAPADEAVRAGFEIDADDNGNKIEQNSDVMNVLDSLGWEEAFSTALYWHRCYGGAVILPIFDGGGLLEEPLDTNNIKKVLQLRVYSARECTWFTRNSDPNDVHYGEPEMYIVNDQLTGVSFNVHASRVIVFPGETVPHHCRQERRDWGGFVLEYIYDQLLYKYDAANDYTSHLIERFSQGVLKIDNMANMCASEPANLQKYLQQIDMTRNILNTLAIDGKDDFELKNVTLTGLDGMLEKYQTALSAVTEIPVTILFGRSPGGQNATGAADFEQYHAMVQRIQRRVLKDRLNTLIEWIGQCSDYKINLPESWLIRFLPLTIPSDLDSANAAFLNAQAENQESQAIKTYVNVGALDPSEARQKLIDEGDYPIDASVDVTAQEPPPDDTAVQPLESGEEE